MKWLTAALLTLALPLLGPAAPAPDKSGKGEKETTPYYPLRKDNQWIYQVGSNRFVLKLTGFEDVGGVTCARLEMQVGGEKKSSEDVAVRKDGVYRYRFNDQDAKPPVCFLKLPPKVGETWNVAYKADGKSYKGTFKMGEEKITVAAGTYTCVTVSSQNLETDGLKAKITYYFAKDVGMVKQVVEIDGQKIVTELLNFTPGKGK